MEQNFYQVLQVDPQAEAMIVRYAYKFLAKKYHPDTEHTGSQEKFLEIKEAWMVLSDDRRRSAYSAQLKIELTEGNLYQLLQVDPGAETSIIRYAYRYLAAKYHPHSETGDCEMVRLLTKSWKVLYDVDSRAAYDKRRVSGRGSIREFGNKFDSFIDTGLNDERADLRLELGYFRWSRDELRLGILQVLHAAFRKSALRGVTRNLLVDVLNPNLLELELALKWLRQADLVGYDSTKFIVNENGIRFLQCRKSGK